MTGLRKKQHAFTLIELLIVMTIIVILAGLTLAAVPAIRAASKKNRTSGIIASAQQGLSVWATTNGGLPAPAEHPLAGTASPRFGFVRADGSGAVANSGNAFAGVELTNLSASFRDRLVLRTDRFADIRAPALYGMPRDELGVLGAGLNTISRVKVLPAQGYPYDLILNPDDAAVGRIEQGAALLADSAETIRYILASHVDELTRIGALYTPPDDLPAHLIADSRVWSFNAAQVPKRGEMTVEDGGTKYPYALRGAALYDAWGNEILYAIDTSGKNGVFISAGRDHYFHFSPGSNGVFDTDAFAQATVGDDRDATVDNVRFSVQ